MARVLEEDAESSHPPFVGGPRQKDDEDALSSVSTFSFEKDAEQRDNVVVVIDDNEDHNENHEDKRKEEDNEEAAGEG
ncbi:homeobox protein B-H1-like [Vespula squamosa]|uniref:Homeobox protein B-H1-like n=1 Tax=Vespula squamosa TaxID=30214 RepID=A0ABD2ABI1_VESSQ